jgi:hypothetical protein
MIKYSPIYKKTYRKNAAGIMTTCICTAKHKDEKKYLKVEITLFPDRDFDARFDARGSINYNHSYFEEEYSDFEVSMSGLFLPRVRQLVMDNKVGIGMITRSWEYFRNADLLADWDIIDRRVLIEKKGFYI